MKIVRKQFVKKLGIGGLALGLLLAFGLHMNFIKLPIEREIDVQYIADFTDDRVLMGASHNVFVAKVIKKKGNKETGIGPETQYEVEIVLNIKGDLSGTVIVDQQGGYKNGVLYLVHDGDAILPAVDLGDELLNVGSTYLFTSRYDEKQNWYTLIPHPNGRKLLSEDESLELSELLVLASSDKRVLALQEAYKNEIVLEADLKNNNARNSYQSL